MKYEFRRDFGVLYRLPQTGSIYAKCMFLSRDGCWHYSHRRVIDLMVAPGAVLVARNVVFKKG